MADSLILKNGKEVHGLVVEEHEDRIIFSTVNGEIPVLRRGIERIEYDDQAQNFLQIGQSYEEKKRYGEALAYYDKAVEVNPNLEEAKKASVRVRNLYWARAATGPVDEVERQQTIYETWGKSRLAEKEPTPETMTRDEWLERSQGMKIAKKGDWVVVASVAAKKPAWESGLRRTDRLVAADGQSLRYLGVEAVLERILEPRLTSFTMEYDRLGKITITGFEKDTKDLGFGMKLDSTGAVISSGSEGSLAEKAGMKKGDVLVEVNGQTTRYMPAKKIIRLFHSDPKATAAVFSVRRSTILTRR